MTDLRALKRALGDKALVVAERLLPQGRLESREWCAGSVAGEPGKSLKVAVKGAKAGVWTDFATGQGGDLIDLWRAVKGQDLPVALDDIRGWLGLERPRFDKPAKSYRRPPKPKGAAPASAVLAYLTGTRMLSAGTIRRYRVGEDGRTIVLPSFLPDGILAACKYLGVDRDPAGKKIIRVEPGCEPVL
ncbi:MAG: phage-like protein [Rhodospirillaceae bacterium]|nr:MAG: phage-like protein [Rhodospirillaceae bacterium]